MLDEDYRDDNHPLVQSASKFFNDSETEIESVELAEELGLKLAQQAKELGISYNPNLDIAANHYRDDNRYLWEEQESDLDSVLLPGQDKQQRRYVSLMEMVNGLDAEFAGDDAQEIWVLETEFYEDDGVTLNEREGKEPVSSPVHYPEWDYQTQLERPNWTTLLEKRPHKGDPETIDDAIEKNKPNIQRLKHLIESLQPQGVIRQRKMEDGDSIDINAAVAVMVDIRMGLQPDPRINIRTHFQIRDLSVVLLIDLSESTNDQVRDAEEGVTVLELAREASALRHAGSLLAQRSSQRKLVLLLTDGEPADNDVRDPRSAIRNPQSAIPSF